MNYDSSVADKIELH